MITNKLNALAASLVVSLWPLALLAEAAPEKKLPTHILTPAEVQELQKRLPARPAKVSAAVEGLESIVLGKAAYREGGNAEGPDPRLTTEAAKKLPELPIDIDAGLLLREKSKGRSLAEGRYALALLNEMAHGSDFYNLPYGPQWRFRPRIGVRNPLADAPIMPGLLKSMVGSAEAPLRLVSAETACPTDYKAIGLEFLTKARDDKRTAKLCVSVASLTKIAGAKGSAHALCETLGMALMVNPVPPAFTHHVRWTENGKAIDFIGPPPAECNEQVVRRFLSTEEAAGKAVGARSRENHR